MKTARTSAWTVDSDDERVWLSAVVLLYHRGERIQIKARRAYSKSTQKRKKTHNLVGWS